MIVGGSLSSLGIAHDLVSSAASVSISVRVSAEVAGWTRNSLCIQHLSNYSEGSILDVMPHNITVVPEIMQFSDHVSSYKALRDLPINFVNGSWAKGYDNVSHVELKLALETRVLVFIIIDHLCNRLSLVTSFPAAAT